MMRICAARVWIYHDLAVVTVHETLEDAWEALAPERVFAFTTTASTSYADIEYRPR